MGRRRAVKRRLQRTPATAVSPSLSCLLPELCPLLVKMHRDCSGCVCVHVSISDLHANCCSYVHALCMYVCMYVCMCDASGTDHVTTIGIGFRVIGMFGDVLWQDHKMVHLKWSLTLNSGSILCTLLMVI